MAPILIRQSFMAPFVPGRLPWSVTRGLTSRYPLDDASVASGANSGVIQDIVGNVYGTNASSGAAFTVDGPGASRGLRFGQGGTANPATWGTSPIPVAGWRGTCAFWIWHDQFAATDTFDVRCICIFNVTDALVIATASDGSYIGFNLPSTAEVSATATLVLNKWQHIAVTFDGTNQKIYYNGVLLTNGAGHADTGVGLNAFGGRSDGSRGLVGRMADIRFYIGAVLTDAEINELYLSAFVQENSFVPDVGQWPALFLPTVTPVTTFGATLPFMGVG